MAIHVIGVGSAPGGVVRPACASNSRLLGRLFLLALHFGNEIVIFVDRSIADFRVQLYQLALRLHKCLQAILIGLHFCCVVFDLTC